MYKRSNLREKKENGWLVDTSYLYSFELTVAMQPEDHGNVNHFLQHTKEYGLSLLYNLVTMSCPQTQSKMDVVPLEISQPKFLQKSF